MRLATRGITTLVARTATAVALTFALTASTADAQLVGTLRFDAAGAPAFASPYGPADVGVLKGTFLSLPGNPSANLAVDLFCVDLPHYVTFDPAGWDVYLTNLGGAPVLDYTRQGARYASTTPDALTRYRKAAWLIGQYATVSAAIDTAGIQGATWLQFESGLSPYSYANAAEQASVANWLASADTFAASAEWNTYDWSRYTVVTDVNAVGLGDDYHGYQELITTTSLTATPEPATFALLATGLAMVGGLAARRRRAQA